MITKHLRPALGLSALLAATVFATQPVRAKRPMDTAAAFQTVDGDWVR